MIKLLNNGKMVITGFSVHVKTKMKLRRSSRLYTTPIIGALLSHMHLPQESVGKAELCAKERCVFNNNVSHVTAAEVSTRQEVKSITGLNEMA